MFVQFLYASPAVDSPARPPRSASLTDMKDDRPDRKVLRGASSASASLLESNPEERAGPSGSGDQRWSAAAQNLEDLGSTLEGFQKALLMNAVYLDEESYGKAVKVAGHGRAVKVRSNGCSAFTASLDDKRACSLCSSFSFYRE